MKNFKIVKEFSHDMSHIKGWGVDADPDNDPTFPMKTHTDDEHDGFNWERPPQQPLNTEVLHSNERPNLTAVYGTSAPPSGLSGMIRRFAFKYGEGSYGHWLPLLLADRVNAVEGIVDDIAHGYIPDFIAEKGMKAEWKHNRKSVVKKVAIGAALISFAALWLTRTKR